MIIIQLICYIILQIIVIIFFLASLLGTLIAIGDNDKGIICFGIFAILGSIYFQIFIIDMFFLGDVIQNAIANWLMMEV